MKKLKQYAKKFIRTYEQSLSQKKLKNLLNLGLPPQIEPVLNFLITGETDNESCKVIVLAEERRRQIASEGGKKIPIWYSSKPNSSGNDVSPNARPEPGKILEFTMEQVARTGKNQRWGTALYIIAREFNSSIAVELGSCAGISAIYLSSAPNLKKLITVEGSEALATIAKKSVHSIEKVQVINARFDDALDNEISSLDSKIDLVFIDGHHEKVATIHYFNRLVPLLNSGSVVLFDDVSWSYDMREAWEILSKRSEFSHAMDFGKIGVCIMKDDSENIEEDPKYWNLQPIVGQSQIGKPHGWGK